MAEASAPEAGAETRAGLQGNARILRWNDLVSLVDHHPLIAAASQRISVARGRLRTARQISNPFLSGSLGRGLAQDNIGSRLEWGVELTIPFDWLIDRGYRIRAAQAGVEVAEQENRTLRVEVLQQLWDLFWTIGYDQALVTTLKQTEAEVAQLAHMVKLRVEKGETRPIESARIETELDKVRIELRNGLADSRTHREQLALWLGDSGAVDFTVDADLSDLPPIPERADIIESIRIRNPAILARQARVQELAAAVGIEKRRLIPAMEVSGFYEDELDRRAYGGLLSLEIPVWNWNTGEIQRVTAEWAAAQKELEALAWQLRQSAIDAYNLYMQDHDTVRRYRDRIIPNVKRTVETVEKTYMVGEISLMDVLDVRRTLLQTNREYLAAQLKLQLDYARLIALTGEIAR